MSDSERSFYTPLLTHDSRKRRSKENTSSSPRNKRRRRHVSVHRRRSRDSIDSRLESRNKLSKEKRNRSRQCENRSRSRSIHRKRTQRMPRHRELSKSSSSSKSSSRSSSTSRISSTSRETQSERSSSSTRSVRRNRLKRASAKRVPHRIQHSSGPNSDFMERFIDALSSHNQNAFVGAHEMIPSFNPSQKTQSIKSWLKKVNETATIYKWSDAQTIFYALPKLSGLARRWYEGLSSVKLSWKMWQRKLLKNFPDDCNYADRLIEMLARKSRREESLEEYFYDKSKLVRSCNIRGKDAVDCIIHGIFDHNVKVNAQGANFKSPTKLLKYLRNITAKSLNKDPRKFQVPLKTNLKDKIPNGVTCYNCSEAGHIAPKCPKEPQN
ncbi:uncharacterized protein LOC123668568 [Melitaea cinxia]|uniref:uncharacterized protein LOC123668568 n=1 Tax=Melitaea cinxia TaxID=113334 RepID=UPI001E271777|nr:uncharacterized protein LOC123668568 [Melitaea cinxia]